MTAPAGDRIGLPPIPRPEDRGASTRYRQVLYAGIALAALYLLFYAWYTRTLEYSLWLGFFVGPILFVCTAPVLLRMLHKVEPDKRIRAVVVGALAAKIIGAYARYIMGDLVLGNNDSGVYHRIGTQVAGEFRSFVFGGPALDQVFTRGAGTNFIRLFTGVVYTFTSTSFTMGFVTFSFMSFWGLYLYYRAFSITIPDGLRLRYALLVFFLPSMVFWPSSIGKDAWMSLTIGTAVYGAARLLAFKRYGYVLILLGGVGMAAVRPHVAAIFGVGLISAFLLRRSGGQGGTVKKLLGLVVFAIAAGVLMSQLQAFFGLEQGLDPNQVFDETAQRTSQGGSQFESAQARSITDLPWAIVTVMFRPFLYEAGSAAGLVSALEGTFLLGLFALSGSKLARLPKQMVLRPYVGFAVLYTLVFVFAFSAVNNFGILSRQRAQLFPIAVVLVCTPKERPLFGSRRDELLAKAASPAVARPRPNGRAATASVPRVPSTTTAPLAGAPATAMSTTRAGPTGGSPDG